MLSSVEQAFVERDEKRAPLKTPAWEAMAQHVLLSHELWLLLGGLLSTQEAKVLIKCQ